MAPKRKKPTVEETVTSEKTESKQKIANQRSSKTRSCKVKESGKSKAYDDHVSGNKQCLVDKLKANETLNQCKESNKRFPRGSNIPTEKTEIKKSCLAKVKNGSCKSRKGGQKEAKDLSTKTLCSINKVTAEKCYFIENDENVNKFQNSNDEVEFMDSSSNSSDNDSDFEVVDKKIKTEVDTETKVAIGKPKKEVSSKKAKGKIDLSRFQNVKQLQTKRRNVKDDLSKESVPKKKIKLSKTNAHSASKSQETVSESIKIPHNLDKLDVTAVLLHMEGKSSRGDNCIPGPSGMQRLSNSSDEMMDSDGEDEKDEEDEEDWEEVEEYKSGSPEKTQLPDGPVEITLDIPNFLKKRKKKEFDWKAYLKRKVNKYKKETMEQIHKVHFLCLLSRGMFLNRICTSDDLQAQALSVLPQNMVGRSAKTFTSALLSRLLQWWKENIIISDQMTEEKNENMENSLVQCLEERKTRNMSDFVLLFVIVLRSLGLDVRLAMSLQPCSLKASSQSAKGKKSQLKKSLLKTGTSQKGKPSKLSKLTNKETKGEAKVSEENAVDTSSKSQYFDAKKKKTSSTNGKSSEYFKSKGKSCRDNSAKNSKTNENTESKVTKTKGLRERGSKVKPQSYSQHDEGDLEDSDDDFMPSDDSDDSFDEGKGKGKTRGKGRSTNKNSKALTLATSKDLSDDSSGSDFEEETTQFRSPKLTTNKPLKRNRRMVSSDSNDSSVSTNVTGCDQWAEVYVETERAWICVNCVTGELNSPFAIESLATQPVHYVIAFDKECCLKDVTTRYASKWLTDTRKLQVDSQWLEESLQPYVTKDVKRNKEEDITCKDSLLKRPMPTSIGEFKNHPLYVLTRHLLKFEAIYPETAVPLGYIRSEPVYARECVYTLHSRENWLKEGRTVRLGEEPYKMVKSRTKWKKPKMNPDALDLECFGYWQTEQYIPPPAVNGKVPRNEYGNIELFMPSMLPAGTVHIKIPGLNKVAKKLNIDCVPAMTGWEAHCGFSHPLLEGFVVCVEHKDILLAAWDEEQEIQRQKDAEKREVRAVGNWKLLTKGLLIRDKLTRRFDLKPQEHVTMETVEEKGAIKTEDYAMSFPTNRKEVIGKSKKINHKQETL